MEAPRRSTAWFFGLSAYWFATSFKWFILLIVILPGQVEQVVPGGEKGTYWGMVVGIGAVWAMFGPSLFGFISDTLGLRGGRRGIFVGMGAALTVVALALLSSVTEIWQIVLGYLLLQFADDVGTGPFSALIPEVVPESERGRASGVMGFLNLFGQLAIGILAIILRDAKLIYLAIGVAQVLCALITIRTIKGLRPLHDVAPKRRALSAANFVRGWVEPWRSPDFRWVWFTRFLNALGFYLVVTYLKFYMGDVVKTFNLLGLVTFEDSNMATNVLALTLSLVGAIGAIWAGKNADRLGRKKVIYTAGVIMFIALVPAALIPHYTAVWLLAAIFALGYGAYQSADWALVADVLPNPETIGKDMGVWQMSISSVQILAGGAGFFVDMGNRLQAGFGYQAAFLLAAVAFLASTVLIRRVKGST